MYFNQQSRWLFLWHLATKFVGKQQWDTTCLLGSACLWSNPLFYRWMKPHLQIPAAEQRALRILLQKAAQSRAWEKNLPFIGFLLNTNSNFLKRETVKHHELQPLAKSTQLCAGSGHGEERFCFCFAVVCFQTPRPICHHIRERTPAADPHITAALPPTPCLTMGSDPRLE